jgi:hypothetical protein
MYVIEGDGSWANTVVRRDGAVINYECCGIYVNCVGCLANVDGVIGSVERIILSGIYMIISDGKFSNSKVIVDDAPLRGVQSVICYIQKNNHPRVIIDAINLPNIIEDRVSND